MVAKRVSEATIDVYTRHIYHFLLFLEQEKLEIRTVMSESIASFYSSSDKTNRTVAKELSALRSFFSYLIEDNIRTDNPLEIFESPKVASSFFESVTYDEVEAILDAIDISTKDPLFIRDKAMFELIYSCGLRVSELIHLQVADYREKERLLFVTGKGDVQRLIPVGDISHQLLLLYMNQSRNILIGTHIHNHTLFVGRRGKGLTRQGVWKRFTHYCSIANVEAKVHTLRHSFASHLIRGGADLRSVQELLGHKDIRTTQIYIHSQSEDMYQQYRTFHPDGQKDDL